MPSYSTVVRWLQDDEEFRKKYAVARQEQAELLAQQIIEIADDSRNDTQKDDQGNEIVNHDHINRARLRVDARKWIASKLLPKVYGEKGNEVNVHNTVNHVVVLTSDRIAEYQDRLKTLEAA